jgi:hypothetical protein
LVAVVDRITTAAITSVRGSIGRRRGGASSASLDFAASFWSPQCKDRGLLALV